MAKSKGFKLTTALVRQLRLDSKPVGVDDKNKIIFEPNPEGKGYFVFCSDQNSPVGFGLRVADKTGKKSYIVQRRAGGKIVRSKVADCADMPLDEARETARDMVREIKGTGRNPNETSREISAAEITVKMAMNRYKGRLMDQRIPDDADVDYDKGLPPREDSEDKSRVARPNTITNFRRAQRRFAELGWMNKRIRDISLDEVLAAFEKKRESAPTANEQNFRWLSVAIDSAIEREKLDAAVARRDPVLTTNPLIILKVESRWRTKDQIDADKAKNNSVNPLGPTTTLRVFLEAAWGRRDYNENRTGVDFLITELAVGARKGELGTVTWGDMLSEEERRSGDHSYVWLDDDPDYGNYMLFSRHITKNRRAHRIPLGPFLTNLLKRRREEAAQASLRDGFGRKGRKWVFPARNKHSKTGYYHDGGYLLDAIAKEVGIPFLNPHDLRRTMGSVMIALDVPGAVQSTLFNHTKASARDLRKDDSAAAVTSLYSRPEWALLREWGEKVQEYVFAAAPNLYNSMKPAGFPPLSAPDPHVPTPPKPRTGRPRKSMLRELQEQEALVTLEGGGGLG